MSNRFWNDTIIDLTPYVPGEQPKDKSFVKLNTNENPYPPSPHALEAARQAAAEELRLYPDPDCLELKKSIAAYAHLDISQIFVGNSSDEVLALTFLALLGHGKQVLFPDITYAFYTVYCEVFHIDYQLVPLGSDFSMQVDGFLKENGGVVICNPNAPTGKTLSTQSIRKILDGNKNSVVVVDEAYVDFGADSVVPLIEEYENLLVIQTFSKSRCLAGMRIGFALGNKDLIAGLETAKNSFNAYPLDRVALAAGVASMNDVAYFNNTCKKIIATRERITVELEKMGYRVLESKANFIFVSHVNYKAKELFEYLRQNNILVRYYNKPRIDDHLRITIGTEEEMDILLEKLRSYTNKKETEGTER